MKVYRNNSQSDFNKFMDSSLALKGKRRRILSSLPLHTISNKLLDKILSHNNLSEEDCSLIRATVSKQREAIPPQTADITGHCGLRNLAAGHAERGGAANRSRLCGAAGENEPQTACRPAAHTGALPPCSRRFRQIHPERFRPGGGLCPKRTADR